VRKKPPQRLAFLAPSFTGKWRVRQKRWAALQTAHLSYDVRSVGLLSVAVSRSCTCYNPSVYTLWLTHLDNRQIHEDLRILFFADHIRTLAESFNS
jgi:hypothetical protein